MRIIVYDDNSVGGGHQTMACHGIEALAADTQLEVICMLNPRNRQLASHIAEISNVQILETPCSAHRLRALKPDLVLCIQGDTGQSTKAVLAAKRAGIECVSYMANSHGMAEMGAKLGTLRDYIGQHRLNRPARYIAISENMKQILIERGVTKPIAIVPNGIQIPSSAPITDHGSRITLGLLGRIEFKQKQQDFMVRTFIDHPEAFGDCRLLIAGNGPDEDKLTQLVSGKENISLLPWQNDPEAFYGKIDFLIIPSRYEGVPLVMLEALARGIPVLGSNRDGMKDLLPEAWTFEAENPEALIKAFSATRKSWQSEIDTLRQKVLSENSIENFKNNFYHAIIQA